jgi:hypothetical protein
MLPDEFQHYLEKEMTPAKCAEGRKKAAFVKKKALSSTPSADTDRGVVKVSGTRHDDVGAGTVAKWPEEFPGEGFVAKGKCLWCDGCGTEVGTAKTSIKKHILTSRHQVGVENAKATGAKKAEAANHLQQ